MGWDQIVETLNVTLRERELTQVETVPALCASQLRVVTLVNLTTPCSFYSRGH